MGEKASLKAFLDQHLHYAWTDNIDALVADYADDAILFTPDAVINGRSNIREFLADFLDNKPPEFPADIKFMAKEFGNDVIYIVWSCGPTIPYATETFVLKNGMITAQTFAACPLHK